MVKKDLSRSFGTVLKKIREAKGVTQEKLSEKADVDIKMISNIERFIRNPSLNLADSLAHALGVPLSELVKEAEELRKKLNCRPPRV